MMKIVCLLVKTSSDMKDVKNVRYIQLLSSTDDLDIGDYDWGMYGGGQQLLYSTFYKDTVHSNKPYVETH